MEYLGIRVAMLDAIQRYHATDGIEAKSTDEKVALMQGYIQQASNENNLLGDNKELVGEAWSRLIGSRDPEAVVAFVENPEIKKMATDLPPLKDQVQEMGTFGVIMFMLQNIMTLKPMVTNFENIAQETGLIDYAGGDTLSDNIARNKAAIQQEHGQAVNEPAPVGGLEAGVIRRVFDNENGPVDQRYVGEGPQFPCVAQENGQEPVPGTQSTPDQECVAAPRR